MVDRIKRLIGRNKILAYAVNMAFLLCSSFMSLLFIIMRIFPIQKNKIVCCNMKGKRYGDNPKYIVDELIKRYPEYEIVWLIRPEYRKEIPEKIRPVKYDIFHIAYELSTAKFWIDSNTKSFGVRKRKGQYYIQTWHGSYGLKKLYADLPGKLPFIDRKIVQSDAKRWDLFLSNSSFITAVYRRAFWYNGEIMECGSPRNDIFFRDYEKYIQKVKAFFHIEGKKAVLYAPTYRNDLGTDEYHLDFEVLQSSMEARFGGQWVVLVRLHPNNIADAEGFITYSDTVINATGYSVMQELLVACDVLISDYSSCMFDFVTKKSPCFMYATDINKYKSERDFYFDIHELPFPLAENNHELQENILRFDEEKYERKLQELFKKVGLHDTGNAGRQVAEWIVQHT